MSGTRGGGGGASGASSASTKPPRLVSGVGESKNWDKRRTTDRKLWERFISDMRAAGHLDESYGEWDTLSEAQLRDPELFEMFAGWLVDAKIPKGKGAGKHYKAGSVTGAIGTALTSALRRFATSTDPQTRAFFDGLSNVGSREAKWSAKLKRNMERILGERQVADGVDPDEDKAPPLFRVHVERMMRNLLLEDGSDSAAVALAILMGWLSSGRAHECSLIALSGMTWNEEFEALVVKMYMKKVGRWKEIVLVAGANRFIDIYLRVAIMLARATPWDSEESAWFVRILQSTDSAGTKLGDLIRRFNGPRYAQLPSVNLPEGACGGSMRPGVCTASKSSGLMRETIAAHTGHLQPGGNVNSYIRECAADTIPVANVIAGHPAFSPGRTGPAARAARLQVLCEDGVDAAKLQQFLGTVFQISSASPPELRPKGGLRMLLEASFASLIMHVYPPLLPKAPPPAPPRSLPHYLRSPNIDATRRLLDSLQVLRADAQGGRDAEPPAQGA